MDCEVPMIQLVVIPFIVGLFILLLEAMTTCGGIEPTTDVGAADDITIALPEEVGKPPPESPVSNRRSSGRLSFSAFK